LSHRVPGPAAGHDHGASNVLLPPCRRRDRHSGH
jgi:hypothetical protein